MLSIGAQPKKTTRTLRPKRLANPTAEAGFFKKPFHHWSGFFCIIFLESRNYSLADLKLRLELSASHGYRA